MASPSNLYIGLMSGTSADSIDAALVNFDDQDAVQVIATADYRFPADIKRAIHELTHPAQNEIDRLGVLDRQMGIFFAEAVEQLLKESGYAAKDIAAIGSHGQTIRHRPRSVQFPEPFTLQIGDPNIIAQRTGITTIADFRRRDMACGGQGAPLAPAFHYASFYSDQEARGIVNIGGIANITCLPVDGKIKGFDTGPGNVLSDAWIRQHRGEEFDRDGNWASSGKIDESMLELLLTHPFFQLAPPKSTGREDFNLHWLDYILAQCDKINPEDVQATLVELTAKTIADAVSRLLDKNVAVYVCGGGAHNQFLMSRLRATLPDAKVLTTDALGISPDWVEAVVFAWLAMRTMNSLPGNLAQVTGATTDTVLGAIYPA